MRGAWLLACLVGATPAGAQVCVSEAVLDNLLRWYGQEPAGACVLPSDGRMIVYEAPGTGVWTRAVLGPDGCARLVVYGAETLGGDPYQCPEGDQ